MTSLSDDGSLFGGQSPGKSKRSTAQASKKQLRKRRPERLSEEESHAKPIKKKIAKKIKGREGKQCRERWHNHLNPEIKKNTWNEREQWVLFLSHKIIGNKWSKISANLLGRTDNAIKNHWNSIMRRRLPDFEDKLNESLRSNIDDPRSQRQIIEDLIKKEQRAIMIENQLNTEIVQKDRKHSTGSTKDEDPGRKLDFVNQVDEDASHIRTKAISEKLEEKGNATEPEERFEQNTSLIFQDYQDANSSPYLIDSLEQQGYSRYLGNMPSYQAKILLEERHMGPFDMGSSHESYFLGYGNSEMAKNEYMYGQLHGIDFERDSVDFTWDPNIVSFIFQQNHRENVLESSIFEQENQQLIHSTTIAVNQQENPNDSDQETKEVSPEELVTNHPLQVSPGMFQGGSTLNSCPVARLIGKHQTSSQFSSSSIVFCPTQPSDSDVQV